MAAPAAAPREELEPLISERRLRTRVAALARHIGADYAGVPLVLVVVLKGATIFAADLLRHLPIPATLEFVAASSYGADSQSSGTVMLGDTDRLAVTGRHVLVVEDILDSGLTSAAILDALQRAHPATLALCTLLRKQRAHSLDLPVRYIGFEIPDDFVVGYGMDYAERYRNLRGVYRLLLA